MLQGHLIAAFQYLKGVYKNLDGHVVIGQGVIALN